MSSRKSETSYIEGKSLNPCCTICLECFGVDEDVSVLTCGHVFHTPCISSWMKTRPSCPKCRARCLPSKLLRIFFDTPDTAASKSGRSSFPSASQMCVKINELKAVVDQKDQQIVQLETAKSNLQKLYKETERVFLTETSSLRNALKNLKKEKEAHESIYKMVSGADHEWKEEMFKCAHENPHALISAMRELRKQLSESKKREMEVSKLHLSEKKALLAKIEDLKHTVIRSKKTEDNLESVKKGLLEEITMLKNRQGTSKLKKTIVTGESGRSNFDKPKFVAPNETIDITGSDDDDAGCSPDAYFTPAQLRPGRAMDRNSKRPRYDGFGGQANFPHSSDFEENTRLKRRPALQSMDNFVKKG